MIERTDSDLGDRFRALRREDAAAARPFDATLASARARRAARPRHRTGWLAAAAVAVARIAVALLLFPPELVMQHQQDIGLRAEQRAGITKAIQEFQTKVVDLQWRMQEQSQRLAALLGKPAVDQAAALAQVDEVLGVEREIKRAHMTLLIQIKNVLSAEQQEKPTVVRAAAPGVPSPVHGRRLRPR